MGVRCAAVEGIRRTPVVPPPPTTRFRAQYPRHAGSPQSRLRLNNNIIPLHGGPFSVSSRFRFHSGSAQYLYSNTAHVRGRSPSTFIPTRPFARSVTEVCHALGDRRLPKTQTLTLSCCGYRRLGRQTSAIMDSGLARFAVLIVLFFLLTGDLAGMVKHMFEESGYGGKQQQQQQQQRNRQQSPAKSARGSDVRPAKAATAKGLDGIDSGPDEDPDMEAFGEQSSEVKYTKYETTMK